MFKGKGVLYLIIISLFVFLSPFVFLCFYIHPSADDYCYTNIITENPFWSYHISNYKYWNGRYFSTLLFSLNPLMLKFVLLYRLLPIVVLLSLIFSIALLTKIIKFKEKVNIYLYAISLIVMLWSLNVIPSTAESIYWLTGSITYFLSLSFLFISFYFFYDAVFISIPSFTNFKLPLTILFYFACIGFNELNMLVSLLIIVFVHIYLLVFKKAIPKNLWILSVFIIAFCFIVIFAPGNSVRSNNYPNQANITYSLAHAFVGFTKVFILHLQSPYLLFFICSLLFLFNQLNSLSDFILKISKKESIFVLGCSVLTIYLCYFLTYFSLGLNPPLRVHGYISLLFTILFFFNFFIIYHLYIKELLKLISAEVLNKLAFFIIFISIALILLDFYKVPGGNYIFRGNIINSYNDLFSNASLFNKQMNKRIYDLKLMKGQTNKIVNIKEISNRPKSIFFLGLANDHRNWLNTCFCKYYNLDSVSVSNNEYHPK